MKIMKPADLDKVKKIGQELLSPSDVRITVGAATCGMAKGSGQLLEIINEEVKNQGLKANVVIVGCNGQCYAEPIIEVIKGKDKITYARVKSSDIQGLVKAAKEGKAAEVIEQLDNEAFYKNQHKIVSKNSGIIAPGSIEEYIAVGGYSALVKALTEMKPEDVLNEVKESKLRGRGGAGFPAGIKWAACRNTKSEKKYIVANGSEGDPEIAMHRSFLESDPHSIIEGMAIAGIAVGAECGYIYLNDRYLVALKRLEKAIDQASELGIIGDKIMGTDFSFKLKVKRGGGAYVCGEETALLNSLEGASGEPRSRPPYPAEKGLFDKPTIVNNLETIANVPAIINMGAKSFASIGTSSSKGTKIIALSGNVSQTCWVEVPMGTKIEDIINIYGKGAEGGKKIKGFQIGGPSGGILPSESLKLELDYDTLSKAGSLLGSGGLLVMDEDTDMLDMAKFFTDFFVDESCGKCSTCRQGTKNLQHILNEIIDGKGTKEHISLIKRLADGMSVNACCALGKTAALPITSVLEHFPEEIQGEIS